MKAFRTTISAVLLGVFGWAFCFFPLPHHVHCKFVIRPSDSQAVYVTQAGTLEGRPVKVGQVVIAGQPLARLENDDLQLTLAGLEGRLSRLHADLATYEVQRSGVADADRMLVETQLAIKSLTREIAIRERQVTALTLVADRDGQVIPPPNLPAEPQQSLQLANWSGTPLDADNHGVWLDRQTLFCYVGDPNQLKAELVVDQSDAKFLAPGQSVDLICVQDRTRRMTSELGAVSQDELLYVPRELSQSNGGAIAVKPGPDGGEQPMMKSYQATVLLGQPESKHVLPGFFGNARVRVGNASLGSRLWRQILTTVNFR